MSVFSIFRKLQHTIQIENNYDFYRQILNKDILAFYWDHDTVSLKMLLSIHVRQALIVSKAVGMTVVGLCTTAVGISTTSRCI